jgi:hypothetical protein
MLRVFEKLDEAKTQPGLLRHKLNDSQQKLLDEYKHIGQSISQRDYLTLVQIFDGLRDPNVLMTCGKCKTSGTMGIHHADLFYRCFDCLFGRPEFIKPVVALD